MAGTLIARGLKALARSLNTGKRRREIQGVELDDQAEDILPEPVPTKRKRLNGAKVAAAWDVGLEATAGLRELNSWKALVSSPLPELPRQIRATCVVSPAPLDELCPLDFQLIPWGSFMPQVEDWFDKHEDGPPPYAGLSDNFQKVLQALVYMTGEMIHEPSATLQSGGLYCLPDCGGIHERFVGIMTVRIDEHPGKSCSLEYLVARLHTYMRQTHTYFGFISSYDTTFACKRLLGEESCISVSPPIPYDSGNTLKALGYVLSLARLGPETAAMNSTDLCLRSPWLGASGPRPFDRRRILRRLHKLAAELNVQNVNKLVQGLVWREDLQELDKVDCLSGKADGFLQYSSSYQGMDVRVSVWDLSSLVLFDTDTFLRSFLREIDVCMRLQDLQGEVIQELVEYGFIRGAMVCFIIARVNEPENGTRKVEISGTHEQVVKAYKLIKEILGEPIESTMSELELEGMDVNKLGKEAVGEEKTLTITYPTQEVAKLIGKLGEKISGASVEVKEQFEELPEEPPQLDRRVFKSHLSKVHARGVHFGGYPRWLHRGNVYTLVNLRNGFVDNSSEGKRKDFEAVKRFVYQDSDIDSSDSE